MKRADGFTLPELLVTMAIIGVITLLALPAFGRLLNQHRSRNAVYALYHHLQFARSSSITKNRVVTLCASTNLAECNTSRDWSGQTILVFIDDNSNGNLDNDDILLETLDFSAYKGSLKWRSFGNKSYLQWFPHGMTHYQNGNFTYCPPDNNPHFASRITLNAIGRAYFAKDLNKDGIVEGSDGKNITCQS